MSTAAEAAVRVYIVKELGRSEVADVNMPELTQSSSRNILAMFGLKCRCTALYSNASDTAEKKAKLALVMWKTATLPDSLPNHNAAGAATVV